MTELNQEMTIAITNMSVAMGAAAGLVRRFWESHPGIDVGTLAEIAGEILCEKERASVLLAHADLAELVAKEKEAIQ